MDSNMRNIDENILKKLKERTKMSEQTIRNCVSTIKKTKCPKATQNAAAQLFAQERGFSVYRSLKKEDKDTLPSTMEIERPIKLTSKSKSPEKKIITFIGFKTTDPFLLAHLEEINRAYTFRCYTCVFIMCRKVIENLLIEILRKKYPGHSKQERELYYDFDKSRFLDLRVIIKNLDEKAIDFGPEKDLVKFICKKAEKFKEDANNKTHSLYHIVKDKKEIDERDSQMILDLISTLFNKI